MKEDDLTFRFKLKDPSKPPAIEQVPFQVSTQIDDLFVWTGVD